MKLNCGPSAEQRRQAARDYYCRWHRWFAWFPVRVAQDDCRWLEVVERKADYLCGGLFFDNMPGDCIYRAIAKEVTE